MSSSFVHLHLHTEYSLVDGMVRVKQLAQAAAKANMPAVAVTDQSNLFSMVKFYRAAMANGVKPIIGVDVWIRASSDGELQQESDTEKPYKLVLLCRNKEGYLNLTELVSRSYLEGQHRGIPMLDRDWIKGNSNGLIALSGAREGDVGRALLAGNREQALQYARFWTELFPDAYYLELQRTERQGDEECLHGAVEIATELGLPVVATNDVRFVHKDDFEAHEARVCINEGRTLSDSRRPRNYSQMQYLRPVEEMCELFSDIPEALENTVEIAKRCNLELELGKNYLPNFPVPEGMDANTYLQAQSREGLNARLKRILDPSAADYEERKKEYQDRLEMELDVIIQMGFPGYFLIVADFIRWAKENGVPVGPGRGSGAGSLVAYALLITDLDPIEHELLFERFLNPERVSMPDFDVDFCMEQRDRVIEYVAEHYGREKVSQIITYGSMAAKAVVRDVGRVLGHPYGFVDRIAKLIPFEIGITLDKALEQEEELRKLYEDEEEVRTLIDLARSLEGLARNAGKHAGGVVIAPSKLTDFTPVYCEQGSTSIVSQFDKDDVEAVGLVKFDFLGLRTLTIIDWAVQTINRKRKQAGEDLLDITDIPMDDAASFDLLKRCATTAVFQLESRGMKDLIKRLQPDNFDEITALVALFRPGPLQSGMVDDFIDRKHGRAKVEYPHPDVEPILQPTYGVILYQEQVMQIAQVLANYTLGGADLLRRAMGKKKPEEMAKQRSIFTEGAVARGVEEKTATYIFDLMEKFAGYGFNKSHSAAYALVSYQTAWLKSHYPAEFMAAVLSSDMDNTDKVVTLIEECRDMRLEVLPPKVNMSEYMFTVGDEETIIYGLGAIKGVGRAAIDSIIEERVSNGPFKDLFDLCRRIDLRKANKRVLEALIRSGALDDHGDNRATLSAQLPDALKSAEQFARNANIGMEDMFGNALPGESAAPIDTVSLPEWDDETRLTGEKDTLGLYLTGHPIDRYEDELSAMTSGRIIELTGGGMESWGGDAPGASSMGRPGSGQERQVVVAGLLMSMRTINTRRGRMAIITLDDRTARIEATIFSNVFDQYRNQLIKDKVLVVQGTLGPDDYTGGYRLNVDTIYSIDQAREQFAKRLMIRLETEQGGNGFIHSLANVLSPYRDGSCSVWVQYQRPGAMADMPLGNEWKVHPTDELLHRLRELAGNEKIEVEY
jgi:DNA polymerase-3 subunit alpha